MAKMRIAVTDRPRVKLECLRMLASLKLDPARSMFVSAFVDVYLAVVGNRAKVFGKELSLLTTP